ncbi:hypothetical protein KC361_g727 [Hortaea werneckii]|nr:hypothetical protein KC361_g727 [Hortaea werneckii]
MNGLDNVAQNEHDNVMLGWGAQLDRLKRKVDTNRPEEIKKQKEDLEKKQDDELMDYHLARVETSTGDTQTSAAQPPAAQAPAPQVPAPQVMDLTRDETPPDIKHESGSFDSEPAQPETKSTRSGRPSHAPKKYTGEDAQRQLRQATTGTPDGKYSKFAPIAEGYGCVVPNPGGLGKAVKLACLECGRNSKTPSNNVNGEPSFFNGVPGLKRHVNKAHPGYEFCNKEESAADVVEKYAVKHLPKEVVDEIKAGSPNAYKPTPRQVPARQPRPSSQAAGSDGYAATTNGQGMAVQALLQAAGGAGDASTTNDQGMGVPTFQAAGSPGNAFTTNNQNMDVPTLQAAASAGNASAMNDHQEMAVDTLQAAESAGNASAMNDQEMTVPTMRAPVAQMYDSNDGYPAFQPMLP